MNMNDVRENNSESRSSEVEKLKVGGFPEELFEDLTEKEKETLFCNICLNVVNQCQQCSNNHLFCRSCIFVWMHVSSSNSDKCPVCRTSQSGYQPVPDVDELLINKKVSCLVEHCSFKSTLQLFLLHAHGKSMYCNEHEDYEKYKDEHRRSNTQQITDESDRLIEMISFMERFEMLQPLMLLETLMGSNRPFHLVNQLLSLSEPGEGIDFLLRPETSQIPRAFPFFFVSLLAASSLMNQPSITQQNAEASNNPSNHDDTGYATGYSNPNSVARLSRQASTSPERDGFPFLPRTNAYSYVSSRLDNHTTGIRSYSPTSTRYVLPPPRMPTSNIRISDSSSDSDGTEIPPFLHSVQNLDLDSDDDDDDDDDTINYFGSEHEEPLTLRNYAETFNGQPIRVSSSFPCRNNLPSYSSNNVDVMDDEAAYNDDNLSMDEVEQVLDFEDNRYSNQPEFTILRSNSTVDRLRLDGISSGGIREEMTGLMNENNLLLNSGRMSSTLAFDSTSQHQTRHYNPVFSSVNDARMSNTITSSSQTTHLPLLTTTEKLSQNSRSPGPKKSNKSSHYEGSGKYGKVTKSLNSSSKKDVTSFDMPQLNRTLRTNKSIKGIDGIATSQFKDDMVVSKNDVGRNTSDANNMKPGALVSLMSAKLKDFSPANEARLSNHKPTEPLRKSLPKNSNSKVELFKLPSMFSPSNNSNKSFKNIGSSSSKLPKVVNESKLTSKGKRVLSKTTSPLRGLGKKSGF